MSCNLVLSRFHENVSWASSVLDLGIDVEVRDRGPWHDLGGYGPLSGASATGSLIELHDDTRRGRLVIRRDFSNVGREGYAYLSYILEHVHDWKYDVTAFCQAQPENRGYTTSKLIDDLARLCGHSSISVDAQPLNERHRDVVRAFYDRTGFAPLCGKLMQVSRDWFSVRSLERADDFVRAFKLPKEEYGTDIYCPSSCFAIRRETVLQAFGQRKATFERLIRGLGASNQPPMAYVLEETWIRLFVGRPVFVPSAVSCGRRDWRDVRHRCNESTWRSTGAERAGFALIKNYQP